MNKLSAKRSVGIYIVILKFLIVAAVVYLYLHDGFIFSEFISILGTILPMTAIYTTAVLKNLIATVSKCSSAMLPTSLVILSFLLPTLFFGAIMGVCILKAYNIGISSFDDLQLILLITESTFAVYLGQIMGFYFEEQ